VPRRLALGPLSENGALLPYAAIKVAARHLLFGASMSGEWWRRGLSSLGTTGGCARGFDSRRLHFWKSLQISTSSRKMNGGDRYIPLGETAHMPTKPPGWRLAPRNRHPPHGCRSEESVAPCRARTVRRSEENRTQRFVPPSRWLREALGAVFVFGLREL
jgi:hypothetical protein